ncbi:CapA family protein [Spirochaeta cellobiosiphila]|uniref:CapA family protein n=1 Tax=Spirochaeta cellobiosiphila TaxID=504483 RepID=UPI0004108915|nr:CapA family protein [Spirochaeta cellobiosiphila]
MKRVILLTLLSILLFSCSPHIVLEGSESNLNLLNLQEEEEYQLNDKQYQSFIPLDEPNDKKLPNLIITVEQKGWNNETKEFENTLFDKENYRLVESVLIKQSWYSPVANLWESDPFQPFLTAPKDIKKGELSSEINKQYPTIINVKDIKAPLKGISLWGSHLGDKHYPLVQNIYLNLYEAIAHPLKDKDLQEYIKVLSSYKTNPQSFDVYWLGANGDMIFQRGVDTLFRRSNGSTKLFNDTLKIIPQVDLMIGNLEGSVTLRSNRTTKSYNFKFPPFILGKLKSLGYDFLSVNNNHSYDYGELGFKDTLKYFKEAKMPTAGVGLTPEEASKPWTFTKNGQKINVITLGAFPQERNGFNGEKQASVTTSRAGILWNNALGIEAVKTAFSDPKDINILYFHGGREYQETPYKEQIKLYQQMIDYNADVVLGSHPHVIQGLQQYKNGLIAYSLGNFIFPGMEEMKHGEESMILVVGFLNGYPFYIEPLGVQISGIPIKLDKTGSIVKRLNQLTKALK